MRSPPDSKIPDASQEYASPKSVLCTLWLSLFLLSLCSASEVRFWITRDQWLGSQSWALALGTNLVRVAQTTRASAALESVDALVSRVRPNTLWLAGPTATAIAESAMPIPVSAAEQESAGPPAPSLANVLFQRRIRRVLLIGASSMQLLFGVELERLFRSAYRDLEVLRLGKISTGLTRPDVLNWPARTTELLGDFHADLVVASFGANDAQNILTEEGAILRYGTPEWDIEYSRRVRELIAIGQNHGARVAMLGVPVMRDRVLSKRVMHVNAMIEAQTEQMGELFVPTWDLTANEYGKYREAVTFNGGTGLMRDPDGKHFTRLGGMYLAQRIAQRLEQKLVLVPSAPNLSITFRHEFFSTALHRSASYLAYIPQKAAIHNEQLPALMVFYGATSPWGRWPEDTHAEIQQLATQHSMVIVTSRADFNESYVRKGPGKDPPSGWLLAEELLDDLRPRVPLDGRHAVLCVGEACPAALVLALQPCRRFEAVSILDGRFPPSLISDLTWLAGDVGRIGQAVGGRLRVGRPIGLRKANVSRRPALKVTPGHSELSARVHNELHAELLQLGIEHDFEQDVDGMEWRWWVGALRRHAAWHLLKLAPVTSR